MAKIKKTNALRTLEQNNVDYTMHQYPSGKEHIDGVSVANLIGKDPSSVFKTLVTVGASKSIHVCVIPVAKGLDLKKVALATKEKKVEMLPVKELLKTTGYIKGGCSPVGMKKQYDTLVDDSSLNLDTMIVSAGKIGMQMEIKPHDLISLVDATPANITKDLTS